jgi:hypothetical protein
VLNRNSHRLTFRKRGSPRWNMKTVMKMTARTDTDAQSRRIFSIPHSTLFLVLSFTGQLRMHLCAADSVRALFGGAVLELVVEKRPPERVFRRTLESVAKPSTILYYTLFGTVTEEL